MNLMWLALPLTGPNRESGTARKMPMDWTLCSQKTKKVENTDLKYSTPAVMGSPRQPSGSVWYSRELWASKHCEWDGSEECYLLQLGTDQARHGEAEWPPAGEPRLEGLLHSWWAKRPGPENAHLGGFSFRGQPCQGSPVAARAPAKQEQVDNPCSSWCPLSYMDAIIGKGGATVARHGSTIFS